MTAENESPSRIFHVWHPLGDTPVTITTSREQLQIIVDSLKGTSHTAAWGQALAEQIEVVLRESLNEEYR